MKIDVKNIVNNLESNLRESFKNEMEKFKKYFSDSEESKSAKPYVIFYRVGDDPASIVYMKAKDNYIKSIVPDIDVKNIILDHESQLPMHILSENTKPLCLGMLIQSPLPKIEGSKEFNFYVDLIDPNKDLDRFHTYWVTQNTRSPKEKNTIDIETLPCTPRGVIALMRKLIENGDLKGKSILIIGRSDIVTKPLVNACINSGMAVTNVSSTIPVDVIENMMHNYDVVVSAVGKPKLFKVKTRKFNHKIILIDVGISRDENNKLSGDFDIDNIDDENVLFTPVPNGVGILTKLMLTSQICSNLIKTNLEFEYMYMSMIKNDTMKEELDGTDNN